MSSKLKKTNKLPISKDLNRSDLESMRDYLLNEWYPASTSEAILMKNLQYIFSKTKSEVDRRCAEVLDKLDNVDNTIIDSQSGLEVLRKSKPSKKVYNETDELVKLLEAEAKLKERIKKAKEKAGYVEVREEGSVYSVKL